MPENNNGLIFFNRPNREGLFTGIGKALTAASLGFQGKDPTSIFDDIDNKNIFKNILDQANLAIMVGEDPKTVRDGLRNNLGLAPISEENAQISSSAINSSKNAQLQSSQTLDNQVKGSSDLEIIPKSITQKLDTLGGTQTTNFDVEKSPEEQGRREGIKKGKEESFKKAQQLVGAIKQINTIREQFDEALPSLGRSPAAQRVNGFLSVVGARTGFIPNEKLLALKKNARPQAIQIIRKFGEVGNLSETEQKGALDILEQEGLTELERAAQIKQFLETALSSTQQDVREFLLQDSDIIGILNGLGVNINGFLGKESINFDVSDLFKGEVSGGK